jgi:hypothetical protein
MRFGTFVVVALLLCAAVAPSALAQDRPDAVLYELTENMTLKHFKDGGTARQATSSLMGTAQPGTALCPMPVVCMVNATGSDDINFATGLGTFKGKFTTVVQGDNAVDSPEFVVLKGSFSGRMDFSPALIHGVPYGTVVGELRVEKGGRYPFTGVFYLPFVFEGDPAQTAFYLHGAGVMPVAQHERALGFPTVKFTINITR